MQVGRRKGFPVRLDKLHWFTLLKAYDWFKLQGANTPEMDEAVALIPDMRPTDSQLQESLQEAEVGRAYWNQQYHIKGTKTVRFRADQVVGIKQLLRAAIFVSVHGQAASTFHQRLRSLSEIDHLDLLADAGRK